MNCYLLNHDAISGSDAAYSCDRNDILAIARISARNNNFVDVKLWLIL